MPVPTAHVLHSSSDQELHSFIRSAAAQALHTPQQQQQCLVLPDLISSNPHSIATPPAIPVKGVITIANSAHSNNSFQQNTADTTFTTISNTNSNNNNSSSDSINKTMKTDRKADHHTKSISVTPTSTSHSTSTLNNNDQNNYGKKRKVTASSERRVPSSSTTIAPDNLSHVSTAKTPSSTSSTSTEKNKRASIDEHRTEEEEDGNYIVETSGNMRKKRVLATPRKTTSSTMRHSSSSAKPHKVDVTDNSMHLMDVDEAQPQKDHMSEETTESISPIVTKPSSGSRKRGNGAITTKATATQPNKRSQSKTSAKDGSSAERRISATTSVVEVPLSSGQSESKVAIKANRSKVTPPVVDIVASLPSLASTEASETPGLQKRVLPTRGRDKTAGLSIEPSLLEPPIAPAGEYILYLANKEVLQRTVLDPKRVPKAAYSSGFEELNNNSHLSTSTSQVLSLSSSSLLTPDTTPLVPTLPPSPSTLSHIEVPIFRPCTINQFLQEEKKRKMQLLTKALAKAEAEAAAEALTSANASAATGVIVPSSRPVSTRQKHKEILNNQQISVQTAAPSSPSSSSHSSGHGKKATTVNTTIGKIEGVFGSNASQEEVLTDEVYEKRHRKQEMAEKKLKNREKEKLRHAMYQQQLVVEKLRHIDINRLMPISAFRSLQKTTTEQEYQHPHHYKDSSNPNMDESSASPSISASSSQQTVGATAAAAAAPISLATAKIMQDAYHRRLLREAEENLRRYEQLGLGENSSATIAPGYSPFSRTKNRLSAMMAGTISLDEKTSANSLESSSSPGLKEVAGAAKVDTRKKAKSHLALSAAGPGPSEGHSRKKTKAEVDSSSTVSAEVHKDTTTSFSLAKDKASATTPSTVAAPPKTSLPQKIAGSNIVMTQAEEPPRPPKPITTFLKPGAIVASGGRKSSRVALAFGEKVPILERMDFDLPLDIFGDLIRERVGEDALKKPEVKKLKRGQRAWPLPAGPSATTTAGVKVDNSEEGMTNSSDSAATMTAIATSTSSSSSSSSSGQAFDSKVSTAQGPAPDESTSSSVVAPSASLSSKAA
ncbi:hypothetical protein BX616_011324 [Lobosporangium transversale]|uniref:Something about silencing protein 4 domain-containing protein n=1 Tax=Lobosporangium transversale TaxID=64571 RepID=A0A1Y2GVV3_9FUNG|nr:hypothetical protein BCR41DRAFT_419947 [Lobosporangium transversale]KAF9909028.1 hypothetical protein BX616_011324 [Lobosporangium transversale]ORZ26430.1 hypothetical protein BCR41DRAFT_419947 [Lobosporangium transversale]|eukprot:XP_021884195.1 hypothetical protein BCR41DRAFT_419947 [Lobosporangium transversale]